MAEGFFLSAISNAVGTLMVNYLVKPVEHRLHYLFCLNKIVEELREQEKNLIKEQTRVQEDVKDAKRQIQTQVIEEYVEEWLTDAEKVLNEAQSLEGRIEENKRCFRWCPNWSWRYKLSKEIERKIVAIKNLVQSSHFERYGHRAELPSIDLFRTEGYLASKSATYAFIQIMDALKKDGVNMIGVCGMGGVGKTTLVTEVGNNAKSSQLFHKVIVVVVSQTPDIEKIQQKIAEFLDLEFKTKTLEGKAGEIFLQLKEKEKVLIILDDVWKKLKLKEIGLLFDEDHKGCKIILTTRDRHVCDSMKSQVTISLDVLDEDEAWTLFEMNALLDSESHDITKMAKEVAKECGGLPIAIVTLARALRRKDLNGWQLARDKLKSSRLMDIEKISNDEKDNAYLCLEMSYRYLERETTKRCFLLCALYPEDYSIDVENLVRYAWGLRFYENADSIQEVRREVIEAVNILKDSFLLSEDDEERFIKMHDVVRDVARWIARNEDNVLLAKTAGNGSENEKEKLEILLRNKYDVKEPIENFGRMPELKVLSLERWEDSFFSSNALQSLTKLRALQLDSYYMPLKGISALANLTKLEILSLRGFKLEESVDQLGELENLRVLDLRRSQFFLSNNLIQRLVQIEELYLDDQSTSTAILPELSSLSRLTSLWLKLPSLDFPEGFKFPRLERYTIDINSPIDFKEIISSRTLRISRGFPLTVFQKVLQNVEFLQVNSIENIKEINGLTDRTTENVSVARVLQNLKYLIILYCPNLQVIFQMEKVENHEVLLSELKYLQLERLYDLEYIWKMPTQHVSLRSLETIKLDSCRKLKSLFSFSLAQRLDRLENLVVRQCHELEQIVEDFGGDEQQISPNMNPNKFLCLPKLRTLKIEYCDSLEYVSPENYSVEAPVLKNLLIDKCPQLMKFSIQTEVNNDIRIHLKDVPWSGLKELLRKAKDLTLSTILNQENLIRDVNLEEEKCKDLAYLVYTKQEHKLAPAKLTDLDTAMFADVEKLSLLEINGPKGFPQCPKIAFLYPMVAGKREQLTVQECGKLREVFGIDEFIYNREENQAPLLLSKLVSLKVKSFPELRRISKGPTQLGNLQFVEIENCNKLKSLFSFSLISSLRLLETLRISDCLRLEMVFGELESDDETESKMLLASAQLLPSLKSLSLQELRMLKSFGAENYSIEAPALENLLISDCPELSNFSIQQDKLLQTKETKECINVGASSNNQQRGGLSNLEYPAVNNFEQLSLFAIGYMCKGPTQLVVSNLISKLEVYKLEGFTYIFTSTLVRNLKNLSVLKISWCTKLEQIIVNDDMSAPSSQGHDQDETSVKEDKEKLMFGKLKELHLECLYSLWSFSPVSYHLVLPSLDSLTVICCFRLITSFTLDSTSCVHAKTKALKEEIHSTWGNPTLWRRKTDTEESE